MTSDNKKYTLSRTLIIIAGLAALVFGAWLQIPNHQPAPPHKKSLTQGIHS